MIKSLKGGHGQSVVHQIPLGMVQEVDFGLESQTGPLHLQVPSHIIQQENNPQTFQQAQKTLPLCYLTIWALQQETMEYQRQTYRGFNK